jgi:hypothetical protein
MNATNDKLYQQLVGLTIDADEPSAALRARVRQASIQALPPSVARHRASRLQARSWRYAAIAAVVVGAALGTLGIWPSGGPAGQPAGAWWLGPPAAWAGEIGAALAQARVRGVTCRERTLLVDPAGAAHESSTISTLYVASDSYRRDILDNGVLREIQWYVPDGGDMLQTSVRFDTHSHCTLRHVGRFGPSDPVEQARALVQLLDQAERVLGTASIAGHACVGFEVRASRYGDNPESYLDRVWFDEQTRLPVRIEQTGRPVTGDASRTFTVILDEFDYEPALDADTFTPAIPAEFIDAHPDELRGGAR